MNFVILYGLIAALFALQNSPVSHRLKYITFLVISIVALFIVGMS